MSIIIDSDRGRRVAEILYNAYYTTGIFGYRSPPESVLPKGMVRGSLQHVLFVTLTVSIDYMRDAQALWESARRTFEDPMTRYLFDPKALYETPINKIMRDMLKYGLAKRPRKDSYIWKTVGATFYKKWGGDPRSFLRSCGWDAPTILKRLKSDTHLDRGRLVPDYPYLRGDKIGPLWLRMLWDIVGVKDLRNLDKVPIPVDVHVARATLATGVVRGRFSGRLEDLFEYIRRAWFLSVKGLKAGDRSMIALDLDEPLWHLSKYGCSRRDKDTGYCPLQSFCVVREYCVKGRIWINNGYVVMDT
ncbi:hypothetical protein [Staphylothermus hellenicus]|uniref:Iron-sulfur cluster loop n=1 Tax=Staphylothermus hellenicus (strain DSM 12710 / JCM 10830 / BK20S6-10-b1 / P8) TaxID=591019 RepID=D7DAY8_STAHD|nr:hypothetical protein [Staphylothermus hellenicus]ADI31335.1 hypothetical protein Shell_0193 [Staphylothermus hellenicus DSM 12710]